MSRQVLDPIFLDRGEIKSEECVVERRSESEKQKRKSEKRILAGMYRGDGTIRAEDQKCATTCSGAIPVEF